MSELVLVVDDDPHVLSMLTAVGQARGFEVVGVRTSAQAFEALTARAFGVAVVDLRLGAASGLDVIEHLRAHDPNSESIIISADSRLSSALDSYARDAFAFVPKPFDPVQLFATVDRAIERRRGALERQRLTWELGLLNEIANIVSSSLELNEALQRTIERLAVAFKARWALLRLTPEDGGPATVRATVGISIAEAQAAYDASRREWPTDRALSEGCVVRIDDALSDPSAPPHPQESWRSTIAVPIIAGDQRLGAISLTSEQAGRFSSDDERLLLTLGRQIGVAVANGQLYERERQHARQLRDLSQELRLTNTELVSTVDRLRSTQAQLVQSEKLSALGLLVAGVAHELNNPLTSIIGFTQLVHEELAARPESSGLDGIADDVSRILSESERAARIVRNLLTFARRQPSERTRQEVADLCARVVQMRGYDLRVAGVEVATNFGPALPPIYADGSQIQQALLNLILNAEQALKDREPRRLDVNVSAEPESGAVLIEVSDTGHGIEFANLRRVFDPFFTTRGVGEGTGLGLSIVYGIVRDHGGQVWVESTPGKRTSFFVRLPARFEHGFAAFTGAVLVAHGDSVFRDFVGAVFAGWGFEVRTAPNMREAIESLAEDDIGLAVLDRSVVEPDPAGWRTAWERVRARAPMIAIMTPSLVDDAAIRFLRDEARVVLAAPHEIHQIRRALVAATGIAGTR